MKKLYSFGHFPGYTSQQLLRFCFNIGLTPSTLIDGRDKYVLTPKGAKKLKEYLKGRKK